MTMESPCKNILLIEDNFHVQHVLQHALKTFGYSVFTIKNFYELREYGYSKNSYILLSEIEISEQKLADILPFLQSSRPDLHIVAMSACKNTLLNFSDKYEQYISGTLTKPFDLHEMKRLLETLVTKKKGNTRQKNDHFMKENHFFHTFHTPMMQSIYRKINQFARSDYPVFIQGEKSTGKSMVARFIHDNSWRNGHEFIVVPKTYSSKDMSENLLFTDANDIEFEKRKSTIFIEEVVELPLSVQAKLASVLRDKKSFVPKIRGLSYSCFRIIAATSKNVLKEIKKGTLREDLYHGLNVLNLTLPPLRKREEDLINIIDFFIQKYNQQHHTQYIMNTHALDTFYQYDWPGNMEQLQNVLYRLLVTSETDEISREDVKEELQKEQKITYNEQEVHELDTVVQIEFNRIIQQDDCITGLWYRVLSRVERVLIINALTYLNGNQAKTAMMLGLNRNTLRKKMHDYVISTSDYLK